MRVLVIGREQDDDALKVELSEGDFVDTEKKIVSEKKNLERKSSADLEQKMTQTFFGFFLPPLKIAST